MPLSVSLLWCLAQVASPKSQTITLVQVAPQLLGALIGLCGVAIGFGLNAWRDSYKDKKRIQRTANQIREELRANLAMLPDKRDVVQQIVTPLRHNEVLPGEGVHFMWGFYTEHFDEMSPHISELERNSLHVIYEYLRVVDETLSSYDSEIESVITTAQGTAAGASMIPRSDLGQSTAPTLHHMPDISGDGARWERGDSGL
jgi:hypothetical protein